MKIYENPKNYKFVTKIIKMIFVFIIILINISAFAYDEISNNQPMITINQNTYFQGKNLPILPTSRGNGIFTHIYKRS